MFVVASRRALQNLRLPDISALRRIGSGIASFFEAAARPSLYRRPNFDSSVSKNSNETPTKPVSAQAKSRGHLFAYLCLAATTVCVVIILVLLKQLGEVKESIARSQRQVAATNAKLIQAQAELHRVEKSRSVPQDIRPTHSTLTLNQSDVDLIRQYIKMPPQPGGKPTVQLGERIPKAGSIPLPESLTSKIPALQGASFLLDQDGSIVLIGKGSDQVDAIVPAQF
jgi:hypothetical protein